MPQGKKIALILLAGVIVLVGVFSALAITRKKLSFDEARDAVAEIAKTREIFDGFFDAKIESIEFDDKANAQIAEFETALEKCGNYMTSLSASSTMENVKVAEKYEAVKAEYGKIEKIGEIWRDVKSLTNLTDEGIEKLSKSQSEALRVLAEELKEYRAEVANFKKKYGSNVAQTDKMMEEYGKMQAIGEDLDKKYTSISLDDVLGMSRDDISGFYEKIEELNRALSEK
ncbi:MAG: hypothetical protein MJ154_01550 [Candidatus Saccharibacteria bacterium]|nr:hypothetical protein [Candidatus Saccharibacteria bacterium]